MMRLLDNIYKFFIKLLMCSAIFLILAILGKYSVNYKNKIHYYIYEDTLNFGYLTDFINKYFGGVSFFKDNVGDVVEPVFDEKIVYNSISDYRNGVKLEVSDNYLVPSMYSGVVSYIGSDNEYGSVYVVKREDNIDVWYGNICNSTLKAYDNIDKGNYIGESCSNYIYLVFKKNEEILDYSDYLD